MTDRAKLEAALRRLRPDARLDAHISDRGLAIMVLEAKGVRADVRTSDGRALRDRPDAYVVQRALEEIADVRLDGAGLNDVFRDAAQKRRRRYADLGRQPLSNSKEKSK
jgi:hypothetical protein